jgi:hypothetical protein
MTSSPDVGESDEEPFLVDGGQSVVKVEFEERNQDASMWRGAWAGAQGGGEAGRLDMKCGNFWGFMNSVTVATLHT